MTAKDTTIERDDLVYIITETITSEGYGVDTELEIEILRLAKLVIARNRFNEDGDPLSEEEEETAELNFEGENTTLDWSFEEEEE